MTILTIRLMGSFRVDIDGRTVVSFKTNKVRGLLAYLVVEARLPLRREALAGIFWPEFSERRARANLSQALLMLRQSLGDDTAVTPLLIAKRDTIQLNPESNLWLDVDVFTRTVGPNGQAISRTTARELEAVAALYEGDFLQDFSLSNSPPFDVWCLSMRERLRRLLSKTLQQLTAYYEREIDYDTALHYAKRLVGLDSWREEAQTDVMRLLALCGRRSEALAQYDLCRRVLAENLGIAPMRRTTEIFEAIRDGQLGEGLLLESVVVDLAPAAPPFLASSPPPSPAAVFVGRDSELAWIDQRLQRTLNGQGQVVYLSGEAGSGKTYLIQEFARKAMARYPELLVASGKGSAYTGLGDPYAAFREIAAQLSGKVANRWAAGTISYEQALRLWRALPLAAQILVNSAPDLIGTFINGSNLLSRMAEFAREVSLTVPQERWFAQVERLVRRLGHESWPGGVQQRALFAQYVRFLTSLARRSPLLLVLDDLQWADVGTIGLLFHISRSFSGQPILLLGAFRPEEIAILQEEKRHPLLPVIHENEREFGEIVLALGQTADPTFVEALVDSEPNSLDVSFRAKLFRQTGGHALYTAELLRGLRERGDLFKNQEGQWVAGAELDWERIPARVEGVIAERIGRLSPSDQRLLQVASVQGESFYAEVVAKVLLVDEGEVLAALSGLLSRDHRLVRAQSFAWTGDGQKRLAIYHFQHFLFQKYLYGGLDTIERARLHEVTGKTLALFYGDHISEMSVQLARHFEVAGIVDKAVHYRLQAGNYAIKLSALEEAIGHFAKGLALLDVQPATVERTRQELALQLGLGTGYQLMQGYGSLEAQRAYSRARDLCRQVGESPQLVAAIWPLATYAAMVGDLPQGVKLAEQAVFVAERVEDSLFVCAAHHHLGWILFENGRFIQSVKHQEESIALYDRQYHEAMVQMFGHDFGVTSLGWIARPLWYLGYPDKALQHCHEAIALAQSFDHPFSLMHAYTLTAMIHALRGEMAQAGEFGERIMAIATMYGFATYRASATFFLGAKRIGRGQIAEGISCWRESLAIYEADGVWLYHRGTLLIIAEMYAHLGQYDLGYSALAEAEALGFEDYNVGNVERVRGMLFSTAGRAAQEIETCYLRAIELARRRQAKLPELQATMNLCRLWQREGRQKEAREKLAAVYNWFTEGFDTADLQAAAVLLEELDK